MTKLGLHTDAITRFGAKMMQTAQCSVGMQEIFVVNVPEIFCSSILLTKGDFLTKNMTNN